jgi:hypothetical protein
MRPACGALICAKPRTSSAIAFARLPCHELAIGMATERSADLPAAGDPLAAEAILG